MSATRPYLHLDESGRVRAVRPLPHGQPVWRPRRRNASTVHSVCLASIGADAWVIFRLWTVHTYAAGVATMPFVGILLLLIVIGVTAIQESRDV